MTPSRWAEWLKTWLEQHPLKEPPESFQQGYAQDVMRRIRLTQPPTTVSRWVARPRAALALGVAAAFALLLAIQVGRAPRQLVQASGPQGAVGVSVAPAPVATPLDQAWELLAAFNADAELADLVAPAGTASDLEDELIQLAEELPDDRDQVWIEDTYELLQELGEAPGDVAPLEQELSEEELLDEMNWLEAVEQDLAAS